jgi:hypothetical protein
MPSKKDKWTLAYLTGKVPAELQGQAPDEPTCGEVVAFVRAMNPEVARRYSSDYHAGSRFKAKVAEAFENYRLETQVEPEKVKLPRLKNKKGEALSYSDLMNMNGTDYTAMVFDEDGRGKPGVREAMSKIINEGRKQS